MPASLVPEYQKREVWTKIIIDHHAEGLMAPPDSMDIVLKSLPLRIGAYVPDDLLEDWFAPRTDMNPPSAQALAAAASYGRRFECEFKHYPDRKEGVFWKWVPAI